LPVCACFPASGFIRRMIDQIYSPLMAAALERLFNPFADYFQGQIDSQKARSQAQDVAVVVAPAHASFEWFVGVDGPDARHSVGGNAHPDSASAYQDASVRVSAGDRTGDSKSINRVIDRFRTMRTDVHDLDTGLSERVSNELFEFKTGVVRAYMDFHKMPPQSCLNTKVYMKNAGPKTKKSCPAAVKP
jgi:hypothetical protein